MTVPSVLILGATSGLGPHLAEEYARSGYALHLAARRPGELEGLAERLRAATGVEVRLHHFDARAIEGHHAFFHGLDPAPAGVVCLVGSLGPDPAGSEAPSDVREVLEVNFVGCAAILEVAAEAFESARAGFIVGVTSVAGDRGRASNYPYGSAKAGFTAYLSGLRQRLHASGVPVLTVIPGYMRTRMTRGMELPSLLTAEAEEAARVIRRAQARRVDVIYVRRIWRVIMLVIRAIPEAVFKRLRL